ncbi:hypothetical protein EMIT0P100_40247 [Pseudomonas sp. IT-P100]
MFRLKLGLQVGQLGSGGDDVEVVERGFVDIDLVFLRERPRRQCLLEEVGNTHRNVITGEPGEVLGRIGLSVEIHQEGSIALAGTDRRQIAGNAGFAYAAFLIEYHAPHVKTSVYQRMTECSSPRRRLATSPAQGLHSQVQTLTEKAAISSRKRLPEPTDIRDPMWIMAKRHPLTDQSVHFVVQNVTSICYTPAAPG